MIDIVNSIKEFAKKYNGINTNVFVESHYFGSFEKKIIICVVNMSFFRRLISP